MINKGTMAIWFIKVTPIPNILAAKFFTIDSYTDIIVHIFKVLMRGFAKIYCSCPAEKEQKRRPKEYGCTYLLP
ncbi:hypothetical protein B0A67_01060 [Flavobacterium aquidurense]|nr:hypothetical protein B0A67_01060 [Flavobacterium aquidurense]